MTNAEKIAKVIGLLLLYTNKTILNIENGNRKEGQCTGNYLEVDKVLEEILEDYADDFSKHAPISEVPKIRWIWDSVPVQLAAVSYLEYRCIYLKQEMRKGGMRNDQNCSKNGY